jgi:hypothetical protein
MDTKQIYELLQQNAPYVYDRLIQRKKAKEVRSPYTDRLTSAVQQVQDVKQKNGESRVCLPFGE